MREPAPSPNSPLPFALPWKWHPKSQAIYSADDRIVLSVRAEVTCPRSEDDYRGSAPPLHPKETTMLFDPVVEIGKAAIAAEKLKRSVQRWMNEQGQKGRLVQADQSPDWRKYEEAEAALAALCNAWKDPTDANP